MYVYIELVEDNILLWNLIIDVNSKFEFIIFCFLFFKLFTFVVPKIIISVSTFHNV